MNSVLYLTFVNIFAVFKSTLYFCEQLFNLHYFVKLCV